MASAAGRLTARNSIKPCPELRQAAQHGSAAAAHARSPLFYGFLHPAHRASAAERLRAEPGLLESCGGGPSSRPRRRGREPLLDPLWRTCRGRGDRAVASPSAPSGSEHYNLRVLAQQHLPGWPGPAAGGAAEFGAALMSPSAGWQYSIDDFSPLLGELPIAAVREWLESVGVAGARVLARHLETATPRRGRPAGGAQADAYVLERFGEDEKVFREFRWDPFSAHYSGTSRGSSSEKQRQQAFLGHPLTRVREWAADMAEQHAGSSGLAATRREMVGA